MNERKAVQCKDIRDEYVIAVAHLWRLGSHLGMPGVVESLVLTGFPEKLASTKVERLVDRGFLEFGTSHYYSWPTEEGLDFLRETSARRAADRLAACCIHDAERHGPDAGGCIECRCTETTKRENQA